MIDHVDITCATWFVFVLHILLNRFYGLTICGFVIIVTIRFKFDDERVTKEDMKRALEEQYGGEEEVMHCFLYCLCFSHFSTSHYNLSSFSFQQLPQTNPGYNNAPFKFTKYSNAYMLVYIRESDKDKIICDVEEKDIAEHLRVNTPFV